MSERATKIILIVVIAIPWSFLIIMLSGVRAFIASVPFIASLLLVLIVLPNYFFFKRCRNILEKQGGAVLSHNTTYSNLCINNRGIKTNISITRGKAYTYISFSTALDKKGYPKFCLRPNDFCNKMVRKIEKKLDIVPDNNLILDNNFVVTENTISSSAVEHLLVPVKEDLLDNIKASPAIDLSSETLVVTVLDDYSLDDIRLEGYLKMAHGMIDSLNQQVAALRQQDAK